MHHSSQRDNKFFLQKNYKNAYIKKSPYFKGYRGCGKLSDVLEFTSNATHMQQVCNKYIDMYRTFFSSDTGKCPFLRVSTNDAFAGEYWMGVLALTDTYSMANIARHEQNHEVICEWHRLFPKFH